jgi:hypothetical protein
MEAQATTVRRVPMILPAPRWTALLIGAGFLLFVTGFNDTLFQPAPPTAMIATASGSTLVRDGSSSPLAPGTVLRGGDEVRVGADGRATIAFGKSEARLAAGSALRIDIAAPDLIALQQLGGRIFHRVAVGDDTTYTVETASLDWTAHGAAFDLGRAPDPGGETVTMTAVQGAVQLSGPNLLAVLDEGRLAVVRLGTGDPELTTTGARPVDLRDPWFTENGVLVGPEYSVP